MYPDEIVIPCRTELTELGVRELRTPEEVDETLKNHSGTTLLVVNSVCGCAAGAARPAVRLALDNGVKPDEVASVFAGVDTEATRRAREYMPGIAPSSPSMALFKNGELVLMVERFMIEGRYPEQIADALKQAFNTHCVN
jgi:putative YphP/YqiW family bacilliredoxin